MMVLNVLMFVLMLICSSIDIRDKSFKCCLSRNLIDFINPRIILMFKLHKLYFTSLGVVFVFIAFVNSYSNRL